MLTRGAGGGGGGGGGGGHSYSPNPIVEPETCLTTDNHLPNH